ncbi:uncharacterized protein EV420DRAFT_1009285 [Desarmillaria tabescens]|uniref:Uncharacterized protein n=1 Tax=Armillaria tabescens TaxID=1929756 RepID=A0AA39JM43_ARMTA|nr:uncharacterized protein EV420DRAFT_1009285 [Desarmillaria tabescens]KAK0444251.1 hypothetical protein EV420DRAFT_1009285 [Desarmillaria tabescens]
MADTTQAFPPWLTEVVSTVTDDSGIPLATVTSIMYLPLTYYGPSIPLGSDWTYGGLTSPASTATSITDTSITTAIPTTTSPATPTTSSTIPSTSSSIPSTSSAIPSSSTSSLSNSLTSSISASTSSSAPLTASSTSSSSTPTLPPSSQNGRLSKGQIAGIVVGSVLALVVLLSMGICYLRSRDYRRRRLREEEDWREKDFVIVDHPSHPPGEGSPRGSGEEVDPFLQRSRDAPAVPPKRRGGAKPGPFRRQAAPAEAKKVPMDTVSSNGTNSSGNKSSSTGSGYGSLLERPTIHFDPEDEYRPGFTPPAPEPLHTLVEESVLQPSDDGNTDFGPSMPPPPPLIDPDSHSSRDSSRNSRQTHRSSYPIDGDEPAMLATARRVRVEDLGPRTSPLSSNSPLDSPERLHPGTSDAARHSGGLLGLGSLVGLGRFSNLFKSMDSSSRRHSRLPSDDLESGQALLANVSPEMSQRPLGPAMSSMSDRPMSSVSAKSAASGATVYHDAQSSIPSTPVLAGVPVLTPPPRALAAPNQAELGIWSPGSVERMRHQASAPGESSVAETSTAPSVPTSPVTPVFSGQIDILDMPAPRGISPFTSASSMKDTPSNSSFGTKLLSYPPGLPLSTPARKWEDISGTTSSMGSYVGGSDGAAGVTIDILEEEPPSAGDGWRSLAGVVPSSVDEVGRRTTFGLPQFIHQPGHPSEQGSLHSMRSHLSPGSTSSAGSAPASLRDPSTGSSKSRGTASSSLVHSGSISSDGRHRHRAQGPMSPALSAFGPASPASSVASPHRAHFSAASSMHDMGMRRGATDDSGPISPLPWAGGLDPNWKPT